MPALRIRETGKSMDRRRYERVPFNCRVTMVPASRGAAAPGQATDISLGGAGIMTAASFEKGQVVTVSFLMRDARQQEVINEVVGRVVNLRADYDANRVGVEFLEPLSEHRQPELTRRVLAL
jgi:c-di-GMP-binding flagellar brake protein YcgR